MADYQAGEHLRFQLFDADLPLVKAGEQGFEGELRLTGGGRGHQESESGPTGRPQLKAMVIRSAVAERRLLRAVPTPLDERSKDEASETSPQTPFEQIASQQGQEYG
eukprot:Skav212183  [mRNA]  locus=scaffold754:489746:493928:- [translate_table: standard]